MTLFIAKELRVGQWIDENGDKRDSLKLSDLGSGYKVLYCFQAWCPGCHSSGFPGLKKLVDGLTGKGFAFAAIQTTFEGFDQNTYEKLNTMQKKYNLAIPFGHDQVQGGSPTIMQDYKTNGTPWFIVINQQGAVVFNDFRLDADALIESINGGQ